jgi:putative 4-mercaptohistidine N1-methyltranferase
MNYEHNRTLDAYLLFHYGSREEILADSHLEARGAAFDDAYFRFPVETAAFGGSPTGRALDLGCAVGRSSFEISKTAAETIGIDFSRVFIDAAESLRKGGTFSYRRYSEAHLATELGASMPAGARPRTIHFETGDAMDLRSDLGDFDFVHAANLLCRLAEPKRLLDRLPHLVRPGGRLVMTTPATWLDDYTPAANQPAAGMTTLDFLRKSLGAHFECWKVAEMPFLMREHGRKFQVSTAQGSVWERR